MYTAPSRIAHIGLDSCSDSDVVGRQGRVPLIRQLYLEGDVKLLIWNRIASIQRFAGEAFKGIRRGIPRGDPPWDDLSVQLDAWFCQKVLEHLAAVYSVT